MDFNNQKELYRYSLSTEKTKTYFPRFTVPENPEYSMDTEDFEEAELQAQIGQMTIPPVVDYKDIG
eukprot:9502660-Alexandrium_andersonii.AAC.1